MRDFIVYHAYHGVVDFCADTVEYVGHHLIAVLGIKMGVIKGVYMFHRKVRVVINKQKEG